MSRKSVPTGVALLVFLLGYIAPNAWGQFTGGIEGTVFDPTGAAVPGANVTVKNVATGVTRTVETAASGNYRVRSLPVGVFEVTVEASGFKTALLENINVGAEETRTINVNLVLGATAAEVTVTAAPPPIELSEGKVSGFIDETKVHDLPLVGRNLYSLVVLTPGVTGLPSGGGQAYAQATADIFNAEYGVNLNSNGQRAESNNFLVDSASVNASPRGGVTNVTPNPESVQEVKILVNNFSAEYGRNAAAIINIASKQGTNDYHGTLSWFHTNNAITSRNIFQPEVPVFRRNEANGSFGGPIVKNQTFFFGSFDILRSGVGASNSAVVATDEFVDFLQQNFPNNISTQVLSEFRPQFDPNRSFGTAESLSGNPCNAGIVATPLGDMPCDFPIFGTGDFNATVPRNGIQWNARIDHNWNDFKDRLYGNFYRTTRQTVLFASPSIYFPHFSPIQPEYTSLLNVNWSHTLSPTVINEMGAGYTRTFGDAPCGRCEIPSVSITGMSGGLGSGFTGVFVQNNYEWRDILAINRGTHNLKIGANAQHGIATQWFTRNYLRPQFQFDSIFDYALDNPFQETNIGFDPVTGGIAQSDVDNIQTTYGAFIQDDWKVRPNLTLNFGLRWEFFQSPHERSNQLTNIRFDRTTATDFFGRITDARVDRVQQLFDEADLNDFAPRFGFAWDPKGDGKMAIRGGFGIFYDRFGNQYWANVRTNPPAFALATARTDTPPTVPVYGLGQTGEEPYNFPKVDTIQLGLDEKNGLLVGKVTMAGTDPLTRTQYGENWSFGIQYNLVGDWVAEANYIGSVGRSLYAAYDVNRFAGDRADGILDRLNSSFGVIGYGGSSFKSSYHGGTASVRNRGFTRGLNFQAAYTFGKAIDMSSSFGPGLSVFDVTDLSRQRGLADFDIRHRLSFSILYNFPRLSVASGALSQLVNGWSLANVTILQSGSPFTVRNQSNANDYNLDGLNYDLPMTPSEGNSLTGLDRTDYVNPDPGGIFNGITFADPPAGMQGDLGRNTFIGPGFANTDLSFIKNTQIPWFLGQEGANLQFRAELFNIFNRVNLGPVQGNMSSGNFGRSTNTFAARNIQFGFRIAF